MLSPRRKRLLWLAAIALGVALIAYGAITYLRLADPTPLIGGNPATTALIEQRAEEAREAGKKPRRRQSWVPLGAIAPSAVAAVLISEDAGFYQHDGVDMQELEKALGEAVHEGQLGRGASTITQQLAKNLWLSSDRSLWRKLKELILARRLEATLTKKRILVIYLNVVEWGDGVYGIEAAAREHFGVSAAQLTPAQGAILAGMLPSPRRWSPARRPRVLRDRALRIVDRLELTGRLGPDDAAVARAELHARLD